MLETAAARALHAGVHLTPPCRAFLQDFGQNTFWRAHCMPMLHYIKDLIILISSHTDTIEYFQVDLNLREISDHKDVPAEGLEP